VPELRGISARVSLLLTNYSWHGNLDAFNDILRGAFGTPDPPWILWWENSDLARLALGYDATVRLEAVLEQCHPTNRKEVRERLGRAQRREGPTLFEEILEIIAVHSPGGSEEEDGVLLELR
jgi:hypothetical protein